MRHHFPNPAALAIAALLVGGCAVVGDQSAAQGRPAARSKSAAPGASRRSSPAFHGEVTLAGGKYEHDIDGSFKDDTSAGFVKLLAEGSSRSGFGGGASLEVMNSKDDLFEGQAASSAQVSTVEFAPYFLYRMSAGDRFRMPIRFGPWVHVLKLDDQGSSDEIDWVSFGLRLAVEPEFILFQSGEFEWSAFSGLSLAGGSTRVRVDTAAVDDTFDSSGAAFGFEIGPRFRWSHLLASISFLHRGLSMKESDPENNVVVRGFDTTFDAIALTIGGRF